MLGANKIKAHHAASTPFVDEMIVIEGYVTDFNFKMPHVTISLNVVDESDQKTEWMATAPAPNSLQRRGWKADTIQEGQYIRLIGKKSRFGKPMVLLDSRTFNEDADDFYFEVNPATNVVTRVIRGPTANVDLSEVEFERLPLNLEDGRPNLHGLWGRLPGRSSPRAAGRENVPLSELGASIQADWDPANDPIFTECAQHGLIRQAISGMPLKITQNEDHLIFEYEEDAITRTIYLDDRGHQNDEYSNFGSHRAYYQDTKLVIESFNLNSRLTSLGGNRLSNQTTTVETYEHVHHQDFGSTLQVEIVISDPLHLTSDWTMTFPKYYDEDYEFLEVDCRVPPS